MEEVNQTQASEVRVVPEMLYGVELPELYILYILVPSVKIGVHVVKAVPDIVMSCDPVKSALLYLYTVIPERT